MKKFLRLLVVTLSFSILISCARLVNEPPRYPDNPIPSDGATNTELSVVLKWECSDPDEDPMKYDVYFGADPIPTTLLATDISSTEYNPGILDVHTTYYWKIVAKDVRAKTEGPVWSFTTLNNDPATPIYIFPANATELEIPVILSWECSDPDGDSLTYDIYFGTNTTPPLFVSEVSDTYYDLNELNGNKTYYWKIVAKDGFGGEREGPIWRFTTINRAPATPTYLSPANGSAELEIPVTLNWECFDPDGDSLTYDIYFGTNTTPPLLTIGIPDTSYTPNELIGHTTYYWKVLARDARGGETEGAVWNFSTTNRAPIIDINNQSVNEGETLTLDLKGYATDPDNDSITFTILNGVGSITDAIYIYSPDYEASGTYNVEIEASDGWGGNATDTFMITVMDINRPPLSPTDPSPTDGESNVSLNPILSWSCSDPDGDSLSYDVYFGKSLDLTTPIATDFSLPEYAPDTLDIHTTYYWKIVAKDGKDETEGPVWSFTTINNAPATPTYLSPDNEATGLEIPVTLSWECSDPDNDPLIYDIYLGISSTPSLYASGIKGESYTPEGIIGHTTYYWKVVAKDGWGGETEGPIWNFSTANRAPTEPGTPFPNVGEEYVDVSTTLSWECSDPDNDSLTYDIFFGTSSTPPLVESNHSQATYNPGTLESTTTYYWKIEAKDGRGGISSSPVWNFTTMPSGTKKWEFEAGDWFVSSPAIGNDGTIYVGSYDNKLYAINPDGTKKWEFDTADLIESSPVIGNDGTIYICSRDHKLYAVNPDGTKKWEFDVTDWIYSTPAIGSDGTIYVGSFDNKLYAINPDGTKKWEFVTNREIESSPIVGTDGTIYVGSDDNTLYAINPDGAKKWEFAADDWIISSPTLGGDGTIYVGSNDNKLYAINPDGTKKWEFATGGAIRSSPAIGSDGTIYVGSNDSKLYAINPDGTKKWDFTTGGAIRSTPAIASDGTIYVGSDDCKLYAVNPDGTKKKEFLTEGMIESSPSIWDDGTIYFGSRDNKLYAIYNDNEGLANTPWPKFHHDNYNTGNYNH